MFFGGCTPNETYVVVKASELKKAVEGMQGTAMVEMVFDIDDKDDLELPNKVRRVALPFLGEGAIVDIEKTEVEKRKKDYVEVFVMMKKNRLEQNRV